MLFIRNMCGDEDFQMVLFLFPELPDGMDTIVEELDNTISFKAQALLRAARKAREAEIFVSRLSYISNKPSEQSLLKELMDGFDSFVVSCSFFGQDCLDSS
jgi:hypothetical protein